MEFHLTEKRVAARYRRHARLLRRLAFVKEPALRRKRAVWEDGRPKRRSSKFYCDPRAARPAAVPRLAGHSGFSLRPGCTQLGGGLGRAEEEDLAASPRLPDTVSHPVPGFSGDAVCHPAPRRRRPIAGPHMPPGTGPLEGEAAAALPNTRCASGSREGDGCMIRAAGRGGDKLA